MAIAGGDTIAHKDLSCAGFPPTFAHLAAIRSIGATRMALARSLITLGPSHRSHQISGPFWWSLRGVATVFSLLRADLRPTPGFMSLTASQRKGDAFLLAEALTHWFAQKHLETNIVVPLEAHSGSLAMTKPSAPYPKEMPKYFRHSVKPGVKSEPDFLAFADNAKVHVLESKGRAGFGAWGVPEGEINKARNKALRQVCRIATVNGTAPVTRTACVFGFDQGGLIGQITDPPETQRLDYRTELPLLIKQAYAVVLDPLFETHRKPIDREHVGIEFAPGWRFGIHKAVYEQVRTVRDDASVAALFALLANFRDEAADIDQALSAGPDGIILSGNPDLDWKRGFAPRL